MATEGCEGKEKRWSENKRNVLEVEVKVKVEAKGKQTAVAWIESWD